MLNRNTDHIEYADKHEHHILVHDHSHMPDTIFITFFIVLIVDFLVTYTL